MDKTKQKVNVLMPVYNGERYLNTSIESILNQTYKDYSFFIIDDGSTDNSLEIIKSYNDPRIKLFTNKENQGLVFILNKSLDDAGCEYIARMDCDDYSLPTRLEKQVEFMESHPDVGVCGTWYNVYNESMDKVLRTIRLPTSPDEIKARLFFGCCMCHPSIIMRLPYLNRYQLRYNPADCHAEDYGLWVRCNNFLKFANIPEILLLYRSTPTGISQVYRCEQIEVGRRIMTENLKSIGIDNMDSELFHVYYRVICGINDYDTINRKRVGELYNLLREGNKVKEYYPEPEFSDILKSKIFKYLLNTITI